MDRAHIGWTLIALGIGVQVLEGLAHADAQLAGVTYDQTAIGAIVGPIENYLPISLGWALLGTGAAVVWLVPLVG